MGIPQPSLRDTEETPAHNLLTEIFDNLEEMGEKAFGIACSNTFYRQFELEAAILVLDEPGKFRGVELKAYPAITTDIVVGAKRGKGTVGYRYELVKYTHIAGWQKLIRSETASSLK